MKYYAVKKGYKTGVFDTWEECEAQVKGYSHSMYKSFPTKEEALRYLNDEVEKRLIAYVDGSFSKDTYGYGVVLLLDGEVIKQLYGKGQHEDMVGMRNVAGEIIGSEVAIRYAIDHHYDHITIYYDYMGIEKWATGEWKANKPGTKRYVQFIHSVSIDITFRKVKAHSNNTYNDKADLLAKKAVGL